MAERAELANRRFRLIVALSLFYFLADPPLTYLGVWFLKEGNPLLAWGMREYGVIPALFTKSLFVGVNALFILGCVHLLPDMRRRSFERLVVSVLLLLNFAVVASWLYGGLKLVVGAYPPSVARVGLSTALLPMVWREELGRELSVLTSIFVAGFSLLLFVNITYRSVVDEPVIDGLSFRGEQIRYRLELPGGV